MERREVEALNASLREFLFPCFNCFSIERTSNWKILLESSSPPPPSCFIVQLAKFHLNISWLKFHQIFLAFSSTFFLTLFFIYYSVGKNIHLCTFSGNEAFRESHFHHASYSRYYLSLSVFVSFLHPPTT